MNDTTICAMPPEVVLDIGRRSPTPSASATMLIPSIPPEPEVGPLVRYNIVRHPDQIVVKTITVRPDGTLAKQAGGHIPKGSTISTATKPLQTYLREAFNGGCRQYIVPANVEIGTDVPLSAKRYVIDGGVDRTTATLVYVESPAQITFDHDPSSYSSTKLAGPSDLHGILAKLFPNAFLTAAWGGYDSSGSFIYDEAGREIAGRRGFHVVFAVENAKEIKAFGDRLFKRLWLNGYGYVAVSKDGKALPRTIFDKKVIESQ